MIETESEEYRLKDGGHLPYDCHAGSGLGDELLLTVATT